ncbi:ABC transporter ATP-binding protein [Roseomonas sp. CCTCC AB2023176]|uniref:ABC transporter ATP-binding protein n=1 Tax=Roseomonas sp. CCTCC AB2023176 TaxID=3342640 RepID=UPI0035DCC9F8
MSASAARGHLSLEGLTRRFGPGPAAVDALSLAVPRGVLLALLGPSGCGKTTTLRLIAGLERADAGCVLVAGRNVTALPPEARNMGVVFQSYALFPHLTAAGNVAFGLEARRLPRAERDRRVAESLALVGLADLAGRKPRALSGGQQQRVALARALAIRPDVLLLDEPLSALDAQLRDEVREEIRALQKRLSMTAVFVTHDQAEALAMADLVAVMHRGRLEQIGPPDALFERPETPFVAGFVGRSSRLVGVVTAPGQVRVAGEILRAAETPAGGAAQVFVRPHRVLVGEAGDLPARVTTRTYEGATALLTLETPVGPLLAEVPAGARFAAGDAVRATLPPDALRIFAA